MKKFIVLFALVSVSCAGHYFPINPSISVEHVKAGKHRIGFAVRPPVGWKEVSRRVVGHTREIRLSCSETSSTILVSMTLTNQSPDDILEPVWTKARNERQVVSKIESAGEAGKYFFASQGDQKMFVGARTYDPCGKHTRCVVEIEAHWPTAQADKGHAAVRSVVESFHFTRRDPP